MARVRLGELLVKAGVLTEEKLAYALREQERTGARLGTILVDHKLVLESVMVDALAKVSNLNRLRLADVNIDPSVADYFDGSLASVEGVVPLFKDLEQRVLYAGVSDPSNVGPLDDMAFRSGLRVTPIVGTPAEIEHLIAHVYYSAPLDRSFASAPSESGPAELLIGMEAQRETVQGSPAPTPMEPTAPFDPLALVLPPLPEAPNATALGAVPGSPMGPDPGTSLSDLFGPLVSGQEQAARELQALFEICVEKGIFLRDDYFHILSSR